MECEYKAGPKINADVSGNLLIDSFLSQAESYINVVTRNNYSDDYAGLDTDVRALLTEAASNLVAVYMIQYDMAGFTSLEEAQTKIQVLKQRADEAIQAIIDKRGETFVKGA